MANFNKAVNAYDTMVSTGKLGKLTQSDLNSIFFILKDLKESDVSGTITKKVAEWFKKYGFTVVEEGVGWQISK